jgi:LemA protein
MMSSTLKSLFAVAENYPQLKADEMFTQFQSRITQIESEIADRREFYNDSVYTFNTRIEQLPDVFIAKMLNYTPSELFKAAESDKQDIDVEF